MHQSVMTKIKNSVSKKWVVKTIVDMVLRFFSVSIEGNDSIEKWR